MAVLSDLAVVDLEMEVILNSVLVDLAQEVEEVEKIHLAFLHRFIKNKN